MHSSRARGAGGGRLWQRLGDLASPSGLLLVAALVVAAILVTSEERDPDFWWHLRTGQLLIANHLQLLGTDPYTYTAAGHHWTMHEWLFEVAIAALDRLSGIGAIVIALTVLTWLGIVSLLLRTRLHTTHRVAIALGAIMGALAAAPVWGPRDQMVDFAFSALLLLIIERYLVRGGRILWTLPPLFLIWSNLHGGFVIGLAFAGIIAAAEAVGVRLGLPDPAPLRRSGWLALTTLACALVSMVNPNGPGILLYAWGTVSSPAQQSLILEWQSPDFHLDALRSFAVMLVSLAAFIAVNRRLRARDAVLVGFTVALAMESVRNVALFVAAATPVWAEQFALLAERLRSRRETASKPRRLPPLPFRVGVLGAVTALLVLGYAGLRLVPAVSAAPDSLAYDQTFPVCASAWLRSAPHGLRIFNQYGEGGYLALSLAGTGDKIFIFGDAALMGDPLLETYASVVDVEPGWEATLLRYGTQVVLFDTGTPLDEALREDPRWTLVYHDPRSDAFVLTSDRASLQLPSPPAPTGSCAQLAAQGLPRVAS
jgi:hypothetical protein